MRWQNTSKVPWIHTETLVEKNTKENIASKIDEGFTILAQDESIFTADAIFRKKMWVKKGSRPIILVNGTHTKRQSYLVHKVIDGRELFRQYEKFDQYCFLDYLKELHRKFGKILVYADMAPQHKSKLIQKYFDDTPDVILHWFPKGSPQFNAIEEC